MFGSQFSSCRCPFSFLSANVELSTLWLRVMQCSLGQSSRPCGWRVAFRRYPEDDCGVGRLILMAADTCWWHALGTVLFRTSPAALPSLAVAREPPSYASGRTPFRALLLAARYSARCRRNSSVHQVSEKPALFAQNRLRRRPLT